MLKTSAGKWRHRRIVPALLIGISFLVAACGPAFGSGTGVDGPLAAISPLTTTPDSSSGTAGAVPLVRSAAVAGRGGAVATTPSVGSESGPAATPPQPKPNIVFVLTDDLSMDLLPHMQNVQRLAQDGTSMSNYIVTDSLCCPSRSSIFTGKFPHDTGVFTNGGSDGGFTAFNKNGNQQDTFADALQKSGYRTAMMGKYLNGYEPNVTVHGKANYVPPGWTEWDVTGKAGYGEFNYQLNVNGHLESHATGTKNYLTNVLSGKASSFITASAAAKKPFFLEVATFAPHKPSVPAPEDANKFPNLKAPRGPAYDTLPTNPPPWLASRTPLTADQQAKIDTQFRLRVQAVQAVDRMLQSLRKTLATANVADNTIIVFSSDNGYHMGQYRLMPGKMTAFDTDINVPLIVEGPGIAAGRTLPNPVENIDLAPTFERFAGLTPPSTVDGRSMAALLTGGAAPDWRTTSLVEHHGPDTDASDPDMPDPDSGNPPSYEAIRTVRYTYVEYVDGAREFYDRVTDPHELHNIFGQLPAARKTKLHAALLALQSCHGQSSCWSAGHMAP